MKPGYKTTEFWLSLAISERRDRFRRCARQGAGIRRSGADGGWLLVLARARQEQGRGRELIASVNRIRARRLDAGPDGISVLGGSAAAMKRYSLDELIAILASWLVDEQRRSLGRT